MCSGVVFLSILFGVADAQRRGFVPAEEASAKTQRKKADTQQKGPSYKRASKARKKMLAREKSRDLHRRLDLMIHRARPDNPRRPEFIFRKAQLHWDDAKDAQSEALLKEQKCVQSNANNPEGIQRCQVALEKDLKTSSAYRELAIKQYTKIVLEHPQYPRMAIVLLQLGMNYQAKGQLEDAKAVYKRIVSSYRDEARIIPEVLLQLGEINFDQSKGDEAAVYYKHIVDSYGQKSSNYGYARYKLGWCRFNQQKYAAAFNHFVKVFEFSMEQRNRGRKGLALEKEVLGDIVRTYVYLERVDATKTLNHFRKIAPDGYLQLAEKLAILYGDSGKYAESNALLKVLINEEQRSYRVVGYRRMIADNVANMGKPKKAVDSLISLVDEWGRLKKAKDAEPKRVKKDRDEIGNMLRRMAVTYHRQASRTRATDDYRNAYKLYTTYLKHFVGGEHEYTMRYYFAELMSQLGAKLQPPNNKTYLREAALSFVKVAEMKPDGDYAKDASHGAVIAFKDLLNLNRTKADKTVQADPEAEIPQPKPLSEDNALFIKACDLYKTHASSKDPYRVDIEYQAALVYYDHAQLDEAKQRFSKIAERMPDHRLATFAADFLLNSYILQKEFKALNATVDRLITLYSEQRAPDLYQRLVALKEKSEFNNCRDLERVKRTAAAECFVRYAEAFESAELADDALWNAALNFYKDRETAKSNEALGDLVEDERFESSALRKQAMFLLAQNFKTEAKFGYASRYFEKFANTFPNDERADDALLAAAKFQEGLGKFDKAIKIYSNIVRRQEGKRTKESQQKAARGFFDIGRIFEEQKDWSKVVKHYTRFLRLYQKKAEPSLVIRGYAKIGMGHWSRAEAVYQSYLRKNQKNDKPVLFIGSKNFWYQFDPLAKKAKQAYKRAFSEYESALSDGVFKQSTQDGMDADTAADLKAVQDAAAEARFRMAEVEFFDFYHRTRLQAETSRDLKKYMTTMKREIKERSVQIIKIKGVYDKVVLMGSTTWAIAALTRSGQMLALLGKEIDDYPAPAIFPDDMKDEFRLQMAGLSEPQRNKAVQSFRVCIQTAKDKQWFNEWSDLADRALATLDPSAFRYSDEVRIEPNTFGSEGITPVLVQQIRSVEASDEE